MTRTDAINQLAGCLADAPNAADYRDWLAHRSNAELATLTGENVIDDICGTAPSMG